MINSCYFIVKKEREKDEILARKDSRCLYTVLYRAFMITAYDVVEHYILAILCCAIQTGYIIIMLCHTDRIYYYYAVPYIPDVLCCAIHTRCIMLCHTDRLYYHYAVPYRQAILSLCCAIQTGYIIIMLCHTDRIYYHYAVPYRPDVLCCVPYIQDILCCAMYNRLGVTLLEVFKTL